MTIKSIYGVEDETVGNGTSKLGFGSLVRCASASSAHGCVVTAAAAPTSSAPLQQELCLLLRVVSWNAFDEYPFRFILVFLKTCMQLACGDILF